MAVVYSMTGLYPGKFIFKKTILPISAGQAVCPLPTTEITRPGIQQCQAQGQVFCP